MKSVATELEKSQHYMCSCIDPSPHGDTCGVLCRASRVDPDANHLPIELNNHKWHAERISLVTP